MRVPRDGTCYYRILVLVASLLLLLPWRSSAQQPGAQQQTRFICTSVPKDVDLCGAAGGGGGGDLKLEQSLNLDLKTTVLQLRETVLQQKETIVDQKETIRELTSKLARCESQSGGPGTGSGRRKDSAAGNKNTMGDHVSRGPSDTLAQLARTLQSLKQRLENLEVGCALHPPPTFI